MKRSHWFATLAWAVVSLPWGLEGCSSQPDAQEQVSQTEDPIHASSCDTYLSSGHSCSGTPPTPAQCQRRGMPDGQGWDRCKYDPKVKNNPQICPQRNPTDPTDVDCKPGGGPCGACPAPRTKNGRPCVQGIFGRLNDGFRYYGCPGYVVINLPNGQWSQGVNDQYEDCFLSGGFGSNMCDPPMQFVSDQNDSTPGTGIPDYNPVNGPGSITAQEWCRALVCGKCTMTSSTCYRTVNGKRTAYPCTKPQNCGGKPDSGVAGRPDATSPRRPGKKAPRPKTGAMAIHANDDALSTCPDVWSCQACDGNTCSVTPTDPTATSVAMSRRAKSHAIAVDVDATVATDATIVDDDGSAGNDGTDAGDTDAGPPDDGSDPTCTGMCDECDANDTSFTPGDGICEDGEDSEDCVCNLVPEDDTDDGSPSPQVDDR